MSPWLLFCVVFIRNVLCKTKPEDIIPLRKVEYWCSHEILPLSPVVLKWRYLPSCYSLFLFSSAPSSPFISAFQTGLSVPIFFPFQQETSRAPQLFHNTFCVLESHVHLALFVKRNIFSPSFSFYLIIRPIFLQFLIGLKMLFNLAMSWVCPTRSSFFYIYSFNTQLCAWNKPNFLRD